MTIQSMGKQSHKTTVKWWKIKIFGYLETLQAFNKPQAQPDKYNIFIYHCSAVVLWLWKKGLPQKFTQVLSCQDKLAFILHIDVFESLHFSSSECQ